MDTGRRNFLFGTTAALVLASARAQTEQTAESGGMAARDVAPDGVFKQGDVVLFIGDSIMHGGCGRDMNHPHGRW